MELLYWSVIAIVEIVIVIYGGQWACKKTQETNAALQAGALAIYAIGIAVVAVAIIAIAYFISVDFLGMKPPITHK